MARTIYCENCGCQLDESLQFCTNCGSKVGMHAVPVVVAPTAQQPTQRGQRCLDPQGQPYSQTSLNPQAQPHVQNSLAAQQNTQRSLDPQAQQHTQRSLDPQAQQHTQRSLDPQAQQHTQRSLDPQAGQHTQRSLDPQAGQHTQRSLDPQPIPQPVQQPPVPQPDPQPAAQPKAAKKSKLGLIIALIAIVAVLAVAVVLVLPLLGGSDSDSKKRDDRTEETRQSDPAGETTAAAEDGIKSLKINQSSLTMVPVESAVLSYDLEPYDYAPEDIIWTSGNTKVAKVDDEGNVRAVGVGTCEITLTVDGVETSCTVKVEAPKGNDPFVGVWKLDSNFDSEYDEEFYDCSDWGWMLVIQADGTGYYYIPEYEYPDGEKDEEQVYSIQWDILGSEDGCDYYELYLDGYLMGITWMENGEFWVYDEYENGEYFVEVFKK